MKLDNISTNRTSVVQKKPIISTSLEPKALARAIAPALIKGNIARFTNRTQRIKPCARKATPNGLLFE